MNTSNTQQNILIVGASRGIGFGFVKHLLEREKTINIYATYRHQETAEDLFKLQLEYSSSLHLFQLDITEEEQICNLSCCVLCDLLKSGQINSKHNNSSSTCRYGFEIRYTALLNQNLKFTFDLDATFVTYLKEVKIK